AKKAVTKTAVVTAAAKTACVVGTGRVRITQAKLTFIDVDATFAIPNVPLDALTIVATNGIQTAAVLTTYVWRRRAFINVLTTEPITLKTWSAHTTSCTFNHGAASKCVTKHVPARHGHRVS